MKAVARGKLRGKLQADRRDPKLIKLTSASDILGPLLRFSFKFLDLDHAVFHCKDRQPGYFHRLLERMKDLSGRRVNELTNAGPNPAIRFHRIDWENDRVSVKSFGIKGWEQFDEDAWQFSISANEHGRVHGFLYLGVFYVVWLDPEHRLYPGGA
jgi:hypothetical protein